MRRREALERALLSSLGLGFVARSTAGASERLKYNADAGIADRTYDMRARDGTYLFHRDWGSGPPVLFLHGWGLNSEFWEYQMQCVVDAGFRAVAFDRRGHGRSGDSGRGYDIDTLADDVSLVVDRLALRDTTVVAHSLGCGEAVRYLTRHGSRRVAALLLAGATLPFLARSPDNPTGIDRAVFDALRARLATNRAQWVADNAAPFWTPDASPALVAWGNAMPLHSTLQSMIALSRTMSETDFRSELRSLRVRTRIVHGTVDRSVPLHFGRATAALVNGSQLTEYEGAPHGLPLTHMERFNAELLAFIRG
jgi:pimeloyl-ACP methyl ester carboxylesterase